MPCSRHPFAGVHLLNPGMLAEKTASHDIFPIIMAAIIKAVDQHGDLLRMAIATPGNDFRLGACDAPPAILSTYLGDAMTEYLQVNWRVGSLTKGRYSYY
jgi:glutamine synthetase